jgi:hypothetical protein
MALAVVVDGVTLRLDRRDVAAWARRPVDDPGADERQWAIHGEAYVAANPRPGQRDRPAPGGAGVAAAQRLGVLRRLAAGPATRLELLEAMRETGWVGADDLENRLRDLRRADRRAGAGSHAGGHAGGQGVHVVADGDRFRLTEPFPRLDDAQRRALTFARTILAQLATPLARQAVAGLDGLLPDLHRAAPGRLPPGIRASAALLQRFDEAREQRRAVRVRYFSMNSGRERTYELVPVRYVPLGAALKAVCVPVNAEGHRTDEDKQFALDRLIEVAPLPDWTPPGPRVVALSTSPIELEVSDGLYQVMRQRDLFGITATAPVEVELGVWRVQGTFPTALAWDVMEQVCAWAGNVQVHRPLWLVNAVCRRLRAGLRVMEGGEDFRLVKPQPNRSFASIGEAVHEDGAWPDEPTVPRGGPARRLTPPRRGPAS